MRRNTLRYSALRGYAASTHVGCASAPYELRERDGGPVGWVEAHRAVTHRFIAMFIVAMGYASLYPSYALIAL